MAVESVYSEGDGVLTIRLSGRFDFSVHEKFRASYDQPHLRPRSVVVDLSRADYLDSAALGMLLILRQHAAGFGGGIVLRAPGTDVARILEIANFGTLFEIV